MKAKRKLSIILCILLTFSMTLSTDILSLFATALDTEVVINEACSGNNGGNGNLTDATDSAGKYCDWIELYNPSSNEVDLSGWGISDNSSPFKSTLPEGTKIASKGYLIIYCCKTYTYIGTGTDTNISVAINISGDGETLTLTKPSETSDTGENIDTIIIPELAKDTTFGCYPDGDTSSKVTLNPTPGQKNVSSVVVFSAPTISQESGIYADSSSLNVDIVSGATGSVVYYTTDSSDPSETGIKEKWDDTATGCYGYVAEFEGTTLDTVTTSFKAKLATSTDDTLEYFNGIDYNDHTYLAFRTTATTFTQAQEFITSIAGSATGYIATINDEQENSAVYAISGQGFYLGALYDETNSKWTWANGENFDFSNFNEEEGTHSDEPYITFGSIVNRKLYSGTLTLTDRTGQANTLATDVSSGLDKGTILKAVAKSSDGEYSEVITKSYFIGSTFKNVAYTGSPIVSLSTDYSSLYSNSIGIHTNPTYKGKAWERKGHFDYIDENGEFKLSANCGIRISGAASRGNNKKSFRLYARSDYGDKNFLYDFFKDSEETDGSNVDKYKSLTLRSGANDAETACYTDNYLQKMLSKLGTFETQEGNICLAFLDGEFWGVYILQENYDATYYKERYEVDSNNVLIIKNGVDKTVNEAGKTTHVEFGFKVEEGEDEDISYYNDMMSWVKSNAGQFYKDSVYEQLAQMIDMESFVDYMSAQMAIGNQDWCNNNCSMWRTINNDTADSSNKYNDGKWRFNMFDVEFSTNEYNGGNKNDSTPHYFATSYLKSAFYMRTSIATSGSYTTAGGYDLFYILSQLCTNTKFAKKFTMRYQDVCNIICDIGHTNAEIQPYQTKWDSIIGGLQHERWPNTSAGTRVSYIKTFFTNRKNYVVSHLSDATKLNLSGESQSVKITTNNISGGKVYLDGLKLYLEDYANNTFSANYLADYDITLKAEPKSGYTFVGWSGSENSTESTITVSMNKAVDIKAVFVADGETPDELENIATSKTDYINTPTQPTVPIYTEPEWNLAEGEEKVAVIFDSTYNPVKTYTCSSSGTYTTKTQAFNAAKSALAEGQTLRMECDVNLEGVTANSSYWTITTNNMTLDVNGYCLSCTTSRVTGFSFSTNVNFSIINSANTNLLTDSDKVNLSFYGNNNGMFVLGSDGTGFNINLVGIKLSCKNTSSSYFSTTSYKCMQNINAYRCYFESGAKSTFYFASSAYSSMKINYIDCIDKNTTSFYSAYNTTNFIPPIDKIVIRLYNSTTGCFNGSTGNYHRYRAYLYNSNVSSVSTSDYTNSCFFLVGKSSIQSCNKNMVSTFNNYSLYTEPDKNTKLDNRTCLDNVTAVYSFENLESDILYGDVNDDDVLDAKDTLALRKYLAGFNVTINIEKADVNGNNRITIKDLLVLRKKLAS